MPYFAVTCVSSNAPVQRRAAPSAATGCYAGMTRRFLKRGVLHHFFLLLAFDFEVAWSTLNLTILSIRLRGIGSSKGAGAAQLLFNTVSRLDHPLLVLLPDKKPCPKPPKPFFFNWSEPPLRYFCRLYGFRIISGGTFLTDCPPHSSRLGHHDSKSGTIDHRRSHVFVGPGVPAPSGCCIPARANAWRWMLTGCREAGSRGYCRKPAKALSAAGNRHPPLHFPPPGQPAPRIALTAATARFFDWNC
jgi:hypothetical protein